MTIKNRLKLNTVISLGAVALIILSLVWSYYESSNANRNMDLVAEIRNVTFERIMLRDDYLLHAEERAKIQWHAKSETLRGLLDIADQRFTDRDDRNLLREARKDFDATFVSFSAFMEHHKRKDPGWAKDFNLTETELMLISQAFLKAYSLTDSINKLFGSVQGKAASVRERSIFTVVFFLFAGITVIIVNSMFLNRLLNKRIAALSKGIEVIGAGDLDYRIDARGDDELSALAQGGNEMASKLKMSHTSVENLQQEITERKKAEENLRQTVRLNQILLDAFPCVALLLRPRTREIVASNAAAVKVGAVPGASCYSTWGQREDPCPWCLAPAVWDTGKEQHLEVEAGGIFWDAHWIPVSEDVYMHFAFDITEQKRAEEEQRNLERQVQQAQKMESLGVLAGGIAHDFNNLLMVVLGHAELALKEISPMSPARGSLTEITTAARRAADLCRQMLAYAGKASFALERVGLRELVEEMAHLLKTAISKKAILNLNLERGLPPIQADPSQIRQIVMNLIMNASDAIGDRSGVITVSVGATRCDEEYLRKIELRDDLAPGLYMHLEVTDTGGGMDAETRSRIFEPFFSTKFTGRGLGLAAVLGIVSAHKGALKVYSEPGKGTTFKILFPALTEGEDATLSSGASPLADWRGKGTILLVDDEESLIALGARMLEHLGFTVLTAAEGLQAVELYRQRGKEIDLVLMDLTMPHMDGAEAFDELRRLNPDVRVVLASGYSHEDVASRFAGKGLAGVLQKPYTLAKLRESLAGMMPKRLDGEE
jgi:signal transduction histidine kinase/CheY-like chemotaxis protein/HAMP domain-containing protein